MRNMVQSRARRMRLGARALPAVVVLLGMLAISSGAAASAGQTLKLTGAVTKTIALNKADCTARPYRGGDIFQVDLPSIQSQTYTFILNAIGPNSSSGGVGTATYVELLSNGARWYHRYLQAPNRIPKKQLHFGPGGRSGNLDLTLSPAPGFSGNVHVVVKWNAADCGTKESHVVVL